MSDENAPEDGVADEEAVEETAPTRDLPDHPVLGPLVDGDESVTWEHTFGQDVVHVPVASLVGFATAAKEAGFELAVDLTVVDYLGVQEPRFRVVVNLLSVSHGVRVRLLVDLPDGADPTVPSLTPLWPGLSFYEREAYDMFGVDFAGHPDLTRILMPDDWEGHPLRKDYGVGAVPVQFKASPKAT